MKELAEPRNQSNAAAVFPELKKQKLPVTTGSGPTEPTARLPADLRTPRSKVTQKGFRTSTLRVANFHKYGELFADFLRVRKEVFINGKGWDLPEIEGMEFDQYDTPFSRWIVIHCYGDILAGVRLTPTVSRCGVYSYMLRDAQRGLLPDIPQDVLFIDAPVNPVVWEASRIFVRDSVPSKVRFTTQQMLIQAMSTEAEEAGARFVIGIVPHVFSRWMRRIGMAAMAIGPVNKIDGDKSQAALMRVSPSTRSAT